MDDIKKRIIKEVAEDLGYEEGLVRDIIVSLENEVVRLVRLKVDDIRLLSFGRFKFKKNAYEDQRNQAGK